MRRARLVVVTLAVAIAAVACKKDSSGPSGVSLANTSYQFVRGMIGSVPATGTGSLSFGDTSFTTNFHITFPIDTAVTLAGGYTTKHTASADSIYLRPPPPTAQIPGTYSVFGPAQDSLRLGLLFSGFTLNLFWRKL